MKNGFTGYLKKLWHFFGIILLVAIASIYTKQLPLLSRSQGDSLLYLNSSYNDVSSEAMNLNHQADSELYHLQYLKAVDIYKSTLKIFEGLIINTPDTTVWFSYASTLFNIGYSYQLSRQFDSSLVYLERCQDVIKEKAFENSALNVLCLFRLKHYYSFIGDHSKGWEIFHRAFELSLFLFSENDLFLGVAYHQMGYHYYLTNDYEKMNFFFQKVEFILEQVNKGKNRFHSVTLPIKHQSPNSLISDVSYFATRYYFENCYNNIILNRPQVARYHYKKAEEYHLLNPGINPSMPFRLKYLQASFLAFEGKHKESLSISDTLIELTKNQPDTYIFIDAYETKTLNYEKMGDAENAFKTMEKCFNLYQPKGDNGIQIYMRTRKAGLALRAGRFDLCQALCDSGMYTVLHRFPEQKELISLNWQNHSITEVKCMTDLLQFKFQVMYQNTLSSTDTNQLIELEKLFCKIHEGTVLLHTKVLSDHNRLLHELENYPLTEKAILLNHRLYHLTGNNQYLLNSLKWSEISKIVLLTQELESGQGSKDSEYNIHFNKIREHETRIKKDELKLKEMEMGDIQEHLIPKNKLLNGIINSAAELEILKNKYSKVLEPLISSRLNKHYPLAEIQNKLGEKESILIDYFYGNEVIVIHMVSSDTVIVRVIDNTKSFQSSISKFIEILKFPNSPRDSLDDLARLLAEQLLSPINTKMDIENSVIIPDGILNFIPFEVLFSTFHTYPVMRYDYSGNLFLTDKTENNQNRYVGFAPTYTGTEAIKQSRGDSILLYGMYEYNRAEMGPLKFNVPEVTESAQILHGKRFTGKNLSQKVFIENSKNAGIIHLALHALADDQNPDYSQFLFKSATDEDTNDPLYAFELNGYQLNANLAILSACNTGAGKYQQGNGVLSLARAFKKAGCQNIIMSLWPVNDASTKEIVIGFIKHLKAGYGKADALAKSKQDFLQSATTEFKHPYYWAGLVLIGDNEKMNFSRWNKWIVIFTSITGALLLISIIKLSKKHVPKAQYGRLTRIYIIGTFYIGHPF